MVSVTSLAAEKLGTARDFIGVMSAGIVRCALRQHDTIKQAKNTGSVFIIELLLLGSLVDKQERDFVDSGHLKVR